MEVGGEGSSKNCRLIINKLKNAAWSYRASKYEVLFTLMMLWEM